jgi:hypothetical protein
MIVLLCTAEPGATRHELGKRSPGFAGHAPASASSLPERALPRIVQLADDWDGNGGRHPDARVRILGNG